jgi:hypothetical protein
MFRVSFIETKVDKSELNGPNFELF